MKPAITILSVAMLAIAACGGEDSASEDQSKKTDSAAQTPKQDTTSAGMYSRQNFILCPALEGHRQVLGTLVGIPQDAEPNKGPTSRFKCTFKGAERGSWLKVELMPAFLTTDQLQPEAFDAPAVRVPEMGEHGWYVADDYLRKTYFTMGSLIITVEAESNARPDKAQMLAASEKIIELLETAN